MITAFTLITFQDFEDCGKVYQCIKINTGISDSQVAERVKMPVYRVNLIRKYLEEQRMIPKSNQTESIVNENEVGREKIVELFSPPEKINHSVALEVEHNNKNPVETTADLTEERDEKITASEEHRCLNCHQKVVTAYYETHEGLCSKCYYFSLLAETSKERRRSGTCGSDRAGTW